MKAMFDAKYIVVKCPICGSETKYRYSMNRETLFGIYGLRYGIDVSERHGATVYFYIPCGEHEEEFKQRIMEYLVKYEKAKAAFRRAVEEEVKKLRSRIIESALDELNKRIESLKPGEGLVFWVCEAGYDEEPGIVGEVYAVVVRESDGNIMKIGGSTKKPLMAYRKGRPYSTTHYTTQDTNIYMSQLKVSWKGFIQGLWIDNQEDLKYIFEAIFHWTHIYPKYTLVDFLRKKPSELYHRFPSIIAKYKGSADPRFWLIVERGGIEQKVKKRIVKRYGIDPSRHPHVKDIFDGR